MSYFVDWIFKNKSCEEIRDMIDDLMYKNVWGLRKSTFSVVNFLINELEFQLAKNFSESDREILYKEIVKRCKIW